MKSDHATMTVPQISLMIVEDDPNMLAVLTTAIANAQDMVLQCVARTRKEGLSELDGPGLDVLLVDLGLPDGCGIDIIKKARLNWPACAIMVSTTFGDELHVMQSLQAGATGYLLKDSTQQSITTEIRTLYNGGSPISPLIARQVLNRFMPIHKDPVAPPTSSVRPSRLSPREVEVLQLITKGFNYDEIADLLNVSRHTVLSFVRRIYTKLAVNSKAEAVYEARNLGLLNE